MVMSDFYFNFEHLNRRKIMIYKVRPENFNPLFTAVGTFVISSAGNIVLLLRNPDKAQPNTWGLPSGKINPGEIPFDAACREFGEETGYNEEEARHSLKKFSDGPLYVRYGEYDFNYHLFSLHVIEEFEIRFDKKEHSQGIWANPRQALISLPLIGGLDECIELFFQL